MKTTNLMKRSLFVAVLAIFAFAGCDKLEPYSIDAPSDLQDRIDSIAAENAQNTTGDTTYISIATTIVGAEDCSTPWEGAFSDYFTIPANKLLHLEFVNHSSGAGNWNNWNLAVGNEVGDRDVSGYEQYFLLRSDAYGWGNSDYDANNISHNYPDTDGDGDIWNDFRTTMQGAYVTLEVDHSATGNAFVTVTAIGTNGTELIQTYNQPVSATKDIVAFLVCDGSYFEMKKAYLIPSKVTVVEDVVPVSITVEGTPGFVEFGNEDFWGSATATVTYEDGSSEQVDAADITFTVIPDMSTLGVKTVIVSYSKTKQGQYCQAVSTFYTLEVMGSVVSMEVTTMPYMSVYYFFRSGSILFNTNGLVVTATFSDKTTSVLANSSLEFGTVTAAEGSQNVLITYVGATSTVTTTCAVTLVKGVAQVGNTDFSTTWFTDFSDDYSVTSGESKTITMYCYSNNLTNYNSPSTVLRKADLTEYAVVRMDNFGWGDGYSTATPTSDWNWDTFASNISGSKVIVTVTNNGDNTADILYNVTYANGETHFQKYEGITVDSADLNCAFTLEGAYIVIVQ